MKTSALIRPRKRDNFNRLLVAYLAATHEEWAIGRRYLRMYNYVRWRAKRDGVPIREDAA